MGIGQERTEFLRHPRIEERDVARAVKEQGGREGGADSSRKQRGAGPPLARAQAIHALPFGGIAISAGDCRDKATLINVDKDFAAPGIPLTQT